MNALVLSLVLAASPLAERCPAELTRAQAEASPHALQVQLRDLAATASIAHRSLPSLEAAADALEAEGGAAREQALEALRDACAQAKLEVPPPAPVDPAALHAILADPAFARRSGQEWALARLGERLWDLFKELLQQQGVRSYSNAVRAAFLVLVLAAAALVLRRVLLRKKETEITMPALAAAPAGRTEPSIAELEALARTALGEGNAAGALRYQMQALVRTLGERGWGDRRGAETNRELVEQLQERGAGAELAERARSLVSQFDRAIYGLAEVDAGDAARFLREATALEAELPERTP